MPGLSNIFGSDDSDSTNVSSNATDGVADISSTLGLDADSSQTNYSQDEDGNISSSTNDNSFGLDTSTDGLLHSVTDSFSGSDQSES